MRRAGGAALLFESNSAKRKPVSKPYTG